MALPSSLGQCHSQKSWCCWVGQGLSTFPLMCCPAARRHQHRLPVPVPILIPTMSIPKTLSSRPQLSIHKATLVLPQVAVTVGESGGQAGLAERCQQTGSPCAGRAQAAPRPCQAAHKRLCLLLSSSRAPHGPALPAPAALPGTEAPVSPPGAGQVKLCASGVTGRGVTASASTAGAPCPQGRAQLAQGTGPGHHLHQQGTTRGFLGEGRGGKRWGNPTPWSSPSSPSRKGDKGGFPGAIPTPTLLPSQCPALLHSGSPPSQQGCSEPELQLLPQHSLWGSPKWTSQ